MNTTIEKFNYGELVVIEFDAPEDHANEDGWGNDLYYAAKEAIGEEFLAALDPDGNSRASSGVSALIPADQAQAWIDSAQALGAAHYKTTLAEPGRYSDGDKGVSIASDGDNLYWIKR